MFCLGRFGRIGWIQPFLPNRPRQNSERGKEWKKICPPNRRDNLLPLLLSPSYLYDHWVRAQSLKTSASAPGYRDANDKERVSVSCYWTTDLLDSVTAIKKNNNLVYFTFARKLLGKKFSYQKYCEKNMRTNLFELTDFGNKQIHSNKIKLKSADT